MIDIIKVIFETKGNFKQSYVKKLRGYLGNRFIDDVHFHNHISSKIYKYDMPLIQYKLINKKLALIGINEGAELIRKNILKVKKLNIDNNIITDFSFKIENVKSNLDVDDKLHAYSFSSPWLPINQKNHAQFLAGKLDLDIVLRNHILTNFKGLSIEADKQILVKGSFNQGSVFYKRKKMISFTGDFMTNVLMPENLSLGQKRALGYGNVVLKKDQ